MVSGGERKGCKVGNVPKGPIRLSKLQVDKVSIN